MNRTLALAAAAALALLAVACGGSAAVPGPAATPTAPATPAPTATVAAEGECPYAHHTDPSGMVDIVRLPPDFCRDWPDQDWSRHTVPFGQIMRGCGGRDCILALDAPGAVSTDGPYGVARFAPLDGVDYADNLPVAVLRIGEVTRGYPLHVLTFHEIVNDEVAGVPVAATFCPLCHTVLAFDRRVEGETLDFGVSGNLRHSDLIMWDRQTETWWQQATGEGIVGRHTGVQLRVLPVSVLSFGDFRRAFPEADVLTEETGFGYLYGNNPYPDYDSGIAPRFFLWRPDSRLPAFERVVTLGGGETALAMSFSALREVGVARVEAAGGAVVVLWAPGTLSALDDFAIADSRDVGSAAAYRPEAEGRALTLAPDGPGRFRDEETGSVWDVTGLAVSGPLAGARLPPVEHTTQFWFAWAAFNPRSAIWEAPSGGGDADADANR